MALGRPHDLAERIRYLTLIELRPVSDFKAIEKHMEVNVFQVTLEFAIGKQERSEFDAIGHGVMVAAGEMKPACSPLSRNYLSERIMRHSASFCWLSRMR